MTKRLAVVAAMSLVLAVGIQAQSNPRLGTWKLNLAKSRFQHSPAPKAETRVYTAFEGDGLTTRVETTATNGTPQVTTFSAHADGKEYPYNSPLGDKITIKGKDWRVVDAVVTKSGTVVQSTHSAVSQDGKTLTMTATYPGDSKTDVRVYDKQ